MLGSISCAPARSATTTRVAAASRADTKSFAALSTVLAVGTTARATVLFGKFSPPLSLGSIPYHPASGCSGVSQNPCILPCSYYPVRLLLDPSLWADDKDLQSPRAVYALDAVQLYIGGRGRAGDEGDGPSLGLDGLFEHGEGFGDEAQDLILPHHAEVIVGQER